MSLKLLEWIDPLDLNWAGLSENPNALELLNKKPLKIIWEHFSKNSNQEAINYLKKPNEN